MNYVPVELLIGAMRKVAQLSNHKEIDGHRLTSIEDAMLQVAHEIEDGMNARMNNETKMLSAAELLRGKFIGDKA